MKRGIWGAFLILKKGNLVIFGAPIPNLLFFSKNPTFVWIGWTLVGPMAAKTVYRNRLTPSCYLPSTAGLSGISISAASDCTISKKFEGLKRRFYYGQVGIGFPVEMKRRGPDEFEVFGMQ